MKHATLFLATLGLGLGFLNAQTVPLFINYQGKVTDSNGVGLGTGTPVNRKVIFRIWSHPSDTAAANRLWTEEQTVTIFNGEFSVLLGQGINPTGTASVEARGPLETVFTSGPEVPPSGPLRYLEITVDNGDNVINATDAAITPRQQITTSAYSFRSRVADTVTGGSINVDALAANSVTTGKIIDGAINNSKIVDGAVDSVKIADASINTAKIQDLSVGTIDLADNAVTLPKMADNAVGTAEIVDGQVSLADLASNSVNSSKIVDGSITALDIFDATITPAKLAGGAALANIAPNSIDGSKLAAGSLTTANIANGSISADKLAANLGIFARADVVSSALWWRFMSLDVADSGGILVRGNGNFSGLVVAANGVLTSDARIKSVVGRSNPVSDLELVRKLQVTDYRMVDKKLHGDQIQKGFIAQEVQEIVPEAVRKMERFPLPSIYAPATKATFDPATKSLRIVLEKEHGLKKGDTVQLKDDKQSWEVNVTETIDATTFVAGPVEAPISDLFVYGKVVDDMLNVDYNRLFTTGIGAIQDLAKQAEAIKAENAELRAKLAALEADGAASNAKMDALEKLVLSIKQPAVRTVSLKAGE